MAKPYAFIHIYSRTRLREVPLGDIAVFISSGGYKLALLERENNKCVFKPKPADGFILSFKIDLTGWV